MEELNGIVERANKIVYRLIRNIFYDHDVIEEWSSYLHMKEKLFNSSIKQPTGTSQNTLVASLTPTRMDFMVEPELTES